MVYPVELKGKYLQLIGTNHIILIEFWVFFPVNFMRKYKMALRWSAGALAFLKVCQHLYVSQKNLQTLRMAALCCIRSNYCLN